jgi:aryl-alcohol dehydrogenase-like predicted oxidoreductase
MDRTRAPDAGLGLSRLAFGCAPVMGRVSRSAALQAMEAAFDRGVTHFDVARSYGYGEAEAVLGKFAADKRDRITIATKFGIRASGAARGLRWIKPAVRQIARRIPYARSAIRAASGNTLVSGHFGLADARSSFEESLRQLRTDYADLLFIHDCAPDDELGDDLLAYLENLVQVGRIRAWGIATRREWIGAVRARLKQAPMVVQCAQDILHVGHPADGPETEGPSIFHSPFGSAGARTELRRLLALTPLPPALVDVAEAIADDRTTARLLLEGALFVAGGNPVLCSMFDPAHLRENIDALERPRFTREQLSALISLTLCDRHINEVHTTV